MHEALQVSAAEQPNQITSAFTNADAILPSNSPVLSQSPPTPQRGFSAFGAGGIRRLSAQPTGLGPRLPVVSRPSMPGSWQTEEDINDAAGRKEHPSASSSGRLGRTSSTRAATSPSRSRKSSLLQGQDRPGSTFGGLTRIERDLGITREDTQDGGRSRFDSTIDETETVPAEVGEGDDDIGTEAERILANAKKRLTAMEGNLFRARSISITRSPSATGDSLRYPPHVTRSNTLSNSWASPSGKLKHQSSFSPNQSSGHSRMHSEMVASTRPQSTLTPQRSMSALAHSPAVQPRLAWTDSSESLDRSSPGFLEPLQEDEFTASEEGSDLHDPTSTTLRSRSSFYSATSSSSQPLNRARSNLQIRDLNEQMAELKGKVNNLKERTVRDSQHRASLQRLKTPSPFTNAADSWESVVSKPSPGQESKVSSAGPSPASSRDLQGTASALPASFRVQPPDDTYSDSPLLPKLMHPRIRHIPPTPTTPAKGHVSSTSSSSNTTTETLESLSPTLSNSFPRPPSTTPTPPRSRSGSIVGSNNSGSRPSSSHVQSSSDKAMFAPSHEDNPEAFDYTRFLLDSAVSQKRRSDEHSRSRSHSTGSNGSNTTTRPRPTSTSTARLSKASVTSTDSHSSRNTKTKRSSHASTNSSATSHGPGQTISQRRASRSGRGSTTSLSSIALPMGNSLRKPSHPQASESSLPSPSPEIASATQSPALGSGKLSGRIAQAFRPGTTVSHTRQLSTDSTYSTTSVASFVTALERASSQLAMRSLSRSALRLASAPPANGSGDRAAAVTHRAHLEAYTTNPTRPAYATGNASGSSLRGGQGSYQNHQPSGLGISTSADHEDPDQPADNASASSSWAMSPFSGRASSSMYNPILSDVATPISATFGPLPSTLAKAQSALLAAVLAISHAAVREEDERNGVAPGVSAGRMMDPADEEMVGKVLEGVLGAAVGLIGWAEDATDINGESGAIAAMLGGVAAARGEDGAMPHAETQESEVLARAAWRMRCEVARRALGEEKPGEGF